jgi:hypothetical protein
VTEALTTRPRCALAVLLLGWLPVGAAGWWADQAWPRTGDRLEGVGWWLACLVLAVAVAAAVTQVLPAAVRAEPSVVGAGLVALGWAVAIAAGWSFDVAVGGPACGLVTGLVLAAARSATGPARAATVGGIGVVAMVLGWVALGDRVGALPVAVSIACGLTAVAAAGRLLAPALTLWPVAGLTAAWGLAWVGAFGLTQATLAEASHGLAVGAETVLATAAGAAVLAMTTRGRTGETTWRVVIRWTVAAAIGVVVGVAMAVLLSAWAVGPQAAGLLAHLDVGTTVGVGAAAGFAVLPTLRALAGTSSLRPGVPA